MKGTVLVVTTVHWPDDTRIRERLIGTLSEEWSIIYATRLPGPTRHDDVSWVALPGGRFRRNLAAIRLAMTLSWDVMVIHDPELLPCAVAARGLRRRPVVFDVHEDVPAAVYTRAWVPKLVRKPLAGVLRWLMAVSERVLDVTLAEPGYLRLFRRPHPVFANYPDTSHYPEPGGDPAGPVVYLGDVTPERGAEVAVEACDQVGVSLRLIGRIDGALQRRVQDLWSSDRPLVIEGLTPNPTAVQALSECSVGLAPLLDLPNYRHSQPTKVLEYLAMGLPVVASDLPGTRQLVEGLDGVRLVPPGDADALATGIRASRSPDVMERARLQAPAVRQRFSWPSNSVLSFYRSLLVDRSGSQHPKPDA